MENYYYENPVFKNAFAILGLETCADNKDVLKRSKEIKHILHMEEAVVYKNDIGHYSKLRKSENIIENARQQLQDIKQRFFHAFFWFDYEDEVDTEAQENLVKNQYSEAIEVWSDKITRSKAANYVYKRNLAICHILNAVYNSSDTDLLKSAKLWVKLINDDSFWNFYNKKYQLITETKFDKGLLEEFKNKSVDYIIELFDKICSEKKQYDVNKFLRQSFGRSGHTLESTDKIYTKISLAVSDLEKLNISEDGVFDSEEQRIVNESLNTIIKSIKELEDAGISDDAHTVVLRDKAANIVSKNVAIDLHNNLNDFEASLKIIDKACEIASSESVISQLKIDREVIAKHVKQDKFNKLFNPIFEKIEDFSKNIKKGIMPDKLIESICTYIKITKQLKYDIEEKAYYIESCNSVGAGIRSLAIDVWNKFQNGKESVQLLELAMSLVSEESLLKQLHIDREVLRRNMGEFDLSKVKWF